MFILLFPPIFTNVGNANMYRGVMCCSSVPVTHYGISIGVVLMISKIINDMPNYCSLDRRGNSVYMSSYAQECLQLLEPNVALCLF